MADEAIPDDVREAGERAGIQFDQAAFNLAAVPTKANRFSLFPISKDDAVLVVGGTLVGKSVEGAVTTAATPHYSFIFNRLFATDLAALLLNRLEITPAELAASKARLKLTD